MTEHYTKSTVAVQAWCKKCERPTMHRVDNGRKGPCLNCLDELDKKHRQLTVIAIPTEEQLELFKVR